MNVNAESTAQVNTPCTMIIGYQSPRILKQMKVSLINKPQQWMCQVALVSVLFACSSFAQHKPVLNTHVAAIGDSVVEVEELIPDKIDEGVLLWHQADELATDVVNYTMLIDDNGELIHRWDSELTGGGNTSYLLESGGLVRMGIRDKHYVRGQPVVAADTVQITDKTGKAIWELNAKDVSINNNKITFHHDMLPMPNGNILILIYEQISAEQAESLGWTAGNGKAVWSDGVIEIEPNLNDGSYELVWQWRFVDHIVQDRNKDAPNYGVIAEHRHRIDAHFPKSYAPLNAVRQHLNSIDYHPELDQVLLSSFIYNEIWVIDHSTSTTEAAGSIGGRSGKGGDLLFRYGNPAAYARGTEKDQLFRRQHDANWIDAGLPGEGNILVFNNNTDLRGLPPIRQADGTPGGLTGALAQERLKGISNVHEIRPAMDSKGHYRQPREHTSFSAQEKWYWEHKDFFAPFQGGARRLPNGNTLISDTVGRRVWELSPDGEIAVRYKGPAPVFKAFKHPQGNLRHLITQ